MKIVHVPEPVLTVQAKTVPIVDKKIKKLVEEMIVTLESQVDPEGVGLAAPQVGQPLRLFIMKPTPKAKVTVCINPEIVESSQELVAGSQGKKRQSRNTKLEGCLSIPRIWGQVVRAPRVFLKYQTLSNETREVWFSGFEAVIVQHEVDHLDGTLFTKRVLKQNGTLYKEEDGELEEYKI